MEERRKNRRMDLTAKIVIKRLDQKIQPLEVDIEVLDVSRSGIGFLCQVPLEIGAVYESYLTIWTKEVLHTFLEIVRIEKQEDGIFRYGAIFIGMSEVDSVRIGTYDMLDKMDHGKE